MVKLFVGGFPLDITELQLVELVSRHGTVSTIKIVRDKKTRKCKGYAFLEMTDLAGAENAIEMLNGTTFKNRELTLNITEDKPVVAKPAYSPRSTFSKPAGSYAKVERRPYSPQGRSSSTSSSSSSSSDSDSDFRKKRPRRQF